MTRSLTVPPERDPRPEWRSAQQRMLASVIRHGWPRRSRRSWRWAIAGLAGGLVLSGGAATAYMVGKPASERNQLRCYHQATLADGDDGFMGTTVVGAERASDGRIDEVVASVDSAVETCAAMWREGFLTAAGKTSGYELQRREDDGTLFQREYDVPPLAPCTLDNGIAAVFPGEPGTCEDLGLPRLLPPE